MDPDIPDSRSTYLSTPNIDRLADGGMRFTNGYAPAPLCTPTRRSILCGTTAPRSGSEFPSSWVPSEHLTIPKALKRVNPAYRCAHFGKWGEMMISSPEECGYDSSDGTTVNVTGGMLDKLKEYHIVEDPKRTESVTRRAIGFMREQVSAGRPFYLQVSYYAPHLRVEVLEATLERYRRKGEPDRRYTPAWAAMLDELDAGIGELLAALDRLGIAEETYVFFMSDNGGRGDLPGGDPSHPPTNHPLSGAKHVLLEGGIRVPFLVRGPGIAARSVSHVPVTGYDLLPTFYELAGGAAPLPDEIDGGSIRPVLSDPEDGEVVRPSDALYFHRPRASMSTIRQGDSKLLIRWSRQGEIAERRLFNLREDVSETEDLAPADPLQADLLQEKLIDYLRAVKVDIP
jgi:arylsulfatase A-like enzyme